MKLAFVFASSESYMPRTKVAMESFTKFHPEIDQHLINLTGPDNKSTYVEGAAKLRINKTVDLLSQGYDGVIVIGSDCVLYDRLHWFIKTMEENSIVLTPHVITPPQHNTAAFYQTGHVNADLIGFTKGSMHILRWLESQPMVNDVRSGMFYEQTLLSAVPFFWPTCKIFRLSEVNYAYFNFHERELIFKDGIYYVNESPLVMAQFSGWEEGQLPKASKHSSIQITCPATLKLFQEYEENVKRFK